MLAAGCGTTASWYMVMGIEDNAEILTMRTCLNSCYFTNIPY